LLGDLHPRSGELCRHGVGPLETDGIIAGRDANLAVPTLGLGLRDETFGLCEVGLGAGHLGIPREVGEGCRVDDCLAFVDAVVDDLDVDGRDNGLTHVDVRRGRLCRRQRFRRRAREYLERPGNPVNVVQFLGVKDLDFDFCLINTTRW